MADSVTIARNDVSPEMADLLRAGAADERGIICAPSQVQANWRILREAEKLGYLRFVGGLDRPWITDEGRAAIGEPTAIEALRTRHFEWLKEVNATRPLVPKRRNDPRTDFDYRSYRANGYVCVLAIRLPDDREKPPTIKVAKVGSNEPQYFGPKNAIVMAESDERFVLALIPKWLNERIRFPTYALALPEGDQFTDAEREKWDHLRNVCISINSRIRNAGRKNSAKLPFGWTA